MKLAALRNKVAATAERTREVRAEVGAKREERRVAAPIVVEPLVLDAEDARKAYTAADVERWLRDGTIALYGAKFVVPRWTVKQRTLAKNLLLAYGEDLVERSVEHYCQTWKDRVSKSRGRITGAPTISLLWAMREVVFAEVQVGPKVEPKNADEYRQDGSPDSGW